MATQRSISYTLRFPIQVNPFFVISDVIVLAVALALGWIKPTPVPIILSRAGLVTTWGHRRAMASVIAFDGLLYVGRISRTNLIRSRIQQACARGEVRRFREASLEGHTWPLCWSRFFFRVATWSRRMLREVSGVTLNANYLNL